MGILLTVVVIVAIAALLIVEQRSYKRGCQAQKQREDKTPPTCPICHRAYERSTGGSTFVEGFHDWNSGLPVDEIWKEPRAGVWQGQWVPACQCAEGFSYLEQFLKADDLSRARLKQFLARAEEEETQDMDYYDLDDEEQPWMAGLNICRRWFFQDRD